MKRIVLACILAFSTTLTACCCTLPISKKEEAPLPTVTHDHPTTTAPESTTTTELPTTTTTVAGVTDYKQVNYPLPVANPDKKLYDAPDGNLLGTFDTIGYFTVVEQATDADGYTWGRLESTNQWTLVYQEILPELQLYFRSGVGAWSTALTVEGKGSFSGSYSDSDMGDFDSDYPNGTCYTCDFTGSFCVTGIDGYAITMEMTSLKTKKMAGTTWIEDGIRYIASDAHGLEGGNTFILYAPETPISQLPTEVLDWSYDLPSYGTLDDYILYCPDTGSVFL